MSGRPSQGATLTVLHPSSTPKRVADISQGVAVPGDPWNEESGLFIWIFEPEAGRRH